MLSGAIRTTGLKLAKPAFIEARGAGYLKDIARKGLRVIDHSVNMRIPEVKASLNTSFCDVIPSMYKNRISKDRDLSRLL